MPAIDEKTPDDASGQRNGQTKVELPEPGELTPHWYSTEPNAELSEKAKAKLTELCRLIGNKDIAARRWEV